MICLNVASLPNTPATSMIVKPGILFLYVLYLYLFVSVCLKMSKIMLKLQDLHKIVYFATFSFLRNYVIVRSLPAYIVNCALIVLYEAGPLLRIFQWRGQPEKGTSGRKGKVEKCTVWGDLGGHPQKILVFLSRLPRLDFLQFPHDFRSSFSDKKGLLLEGGQNSSVEGPTQGLGGGALAPPVYM